MAGQESKLVQVVRASAQRRGLVDASVVVGFSGGRDSTVLLASLRSVVRQVTAVHVDHGVRSESAAEAERAATIAAGLGVRCDVVRLDPDRVASHRGVGQEEALRRERYLALAAAGGDAVAVGHHALDQAETVLAHLLRGAGLRGMAGMREWTMRAVPWWTASEVDIAVWRPFLPVRPEALDAEIARLGLTPVVDASNDDRAYRRNAIRHDVLPLLESVQPGSISALGRFAELAATDDDLLDHLARAALNSGESIATEAFRSLDPALQGRAVRQWLLSSTTFLELSYERTDSVVQAILANRGGSRIEIGGDCVVAIDDGVARIVQR